MTLSAALLAETQQPAVGGTGWFLPVMLLAMVLLLWLPMRRQKKAQAALKEKQSTMGPGTQVMTGFGLYGTVVSIDREQNKAVLEVSPGTTVTVHTQTLTTVLDETSTDTPATDAPATKDVVSEGSTAAGAAGQAHRVTQDDATGTPPDERRTESTN